MTRFYIEYFKDVDILLVTTLVNVFCQRYNNFLYLKHQTFYEYLDAESQNTISQWFYQYLNSIDVSEDPLHFAEYIIKHYGSDEYNHIISNIRELMDGYISDSKINHSFREELFYFIKSYCREDDMDNVYSVLSGTINDYISNYNANYEDLMNDQQLVPVVQQLCSSEDYSFDVLCRKILHYTDSTIGSAFCKSGLISLMVYIIVKAYKVKPKQFDWFDIITCVANKECSGEVFGRCYLNI